MREEVGWLHIKALADNKSLTIDWVEFDDMYFLSVSWSVFELTHKMKKVASPAEGSDQKDFEDNYKV